MYECTNCIETVYVQMNLKKFDAKYTWYKNVMRIYTYIRIYKHTNKQTHRQQYICKRST